MRTSDVKALEAQIDAGWILTPLPFADWRQSSVALMTVAEDDVRRIGPGAADNFKYIMRSLLELARTKCVGDLSNPQSPPTNSVYGICRTAIDAADAYESARLAFGCYWAGAADATDMARKIAFSHKLCARHEMLDQIAASHSCDMDPMINASKWIANRIIDDSSIDLNSSRVTYKFRASVPERLSQSLPPPRRFLPAGWVAWNINDLDVGRILRALFFRCLYHAVAVHTIAPHHAIAGGGLDDLVLQIGWHPLQRQIASLSNVDLAKVSTILGALRYGEQTTSPDPALQPIVPISKDMVALPCWHVATSSVERNLLALQARLRPKEFDGQSHLFEREMLHKLQTTLGRLGFAAQPSIMTAAGEVDLAFSTPDHKCIVIVECKWFIPPGDIRETIQRIPRVLAGVDQVRAKRAACIQSGALEKVLGMPHKPSHYLGVVVTEGFSSASQDPAIPCVPAPVFTRVLENVARGDDLSNMLTGQPWLPVDGKHFTRESLNHTIAGITFSWSAHSLLPEAEDLGQAWVAAETDSAIPLRQ